MVTPAQSSQSIQPCIPLAPQSNNANFSRIAVIAIPLIVALASFLVLSAEAAIAITAVVTIGAIAYAMRAKNTQSQPSSAIEPSAVAANPSHPQEIIFMSPKRNDKCDINKAEYMTIFFKTNEAAKQFIENHTHKFKGGGWDDLVKFPKRVHLYPGQEPMEKSVNTLKAIYGHDGSLSLLCPISFAHSQK